MYYLDSKKYFHSHQYQCKACLIPIICGNDVIVNISRYEKYFPPVPWEHFVLPVWYKTLLDLHVGVSRIL